MRRGDRPAEHRLEDAQVEQRLEARAGPGQHPTPGELEQAVHEEQAGDQNQERHQRFLGPAGEDAVIDLQHEKGTGQHQEIDEDAENTNRDQVPPAGSHHRPQLGEALLAFPLTHSLVPRAPDKARIIARKA